MTRIDFYLLQDVARAAMYRFACALTVKARSNGQRVYLHAASEASARELDELLWRYPAERFVPHQLGEADADAPVIIATQPPAQVEGLMINLSHDVPAFFGRFDRVAEVVVGDEREQGRTRYKHYRDRGCPLYHHELDDWEARL